ncbi:unnamed protein product [Cercopithifilaria johnstoni]|uniref:Uncharacterized protein n=1 Tax=Cercopithifilaria johnstoni TaxID=2874296 RepID=A0A8J2Q7C0_9BILA|nr:unnamed protein product [Cercopithifilaria johnstoni]
MPTARYQTYLQEFGSLIKMPFLIIEYFIPLTIVTLLSVSETNAQSRFFSFLSFNNIAGDNSLNNFAAARPAAQPPAPAPAQPVAPAPAPAQPALNPLGLLSPAFPFGLGLLAGGLIGRGSQFPPFPFNFGFRRFGPSRLIYPYYGRYPYYYYYYYRG